MPTFNNSLFSQRRNRVFDVQKHHSKHKKLVESTKATPNNNHTKERKRKVSRLRQLAVFSAVRYWFAENLRNYCNSTSLHGFNYITLKGSTVNERRFWIPTVIVSIIISIVLVTVSWFSNREDLTVTVIESAHYPTWNIPFPAVTICSLNKISKTSAMNLAKTFKRPSNVSEEKLLSLFRITMPFSFVVDFTIEDYRTLEEVLTANNITLSKLTLQLTPDCREMITKCMWQGSGTRCDLFFQPIQAMESACCSFNYYARPTTNFRRKIAYQIPKDPYRVSGCGYSTGLTLELNPMVNDYFGTYLSSYGFRLLLHRPYSLPDENSSKKVVSSGHETFVRISPESTYASNDVKKVNSKLRNCLLPHERKLLLMKRYTFINCMAECRLSILYNRCGCIPMGLPNNGSFRICVLSQMHCIMKTRDIFTLAIPTINRTLMKLQKTHEFPCGCLPDCEFASYPSELTRGRLDSRYVSTKRYGNELVNANEQTILHVFFSDLMSKRYRKDVYQDWLSSLGSFGGLLGLIMGFSIVAAFEFIYFLTFRPLLNLLN
ncbi:pickpocket protein 11-like [Anastrepha obliqua]|uniref:pickpocket protein 11-like n=1 Tax=Anastrepha obliqua TaxID=95512 RepID=UPI00240929C6|nr:pickpocket protein 11-like [Anastrepha obliqua]